MARPRHFDEQQIRDRARDLFWTAGYRAVSVADLEAVTGLDRRGLYNVFGDKQGLFLAALDDFAREAEVAFLGELLRPDAARDAIASTLRGLAAAAAGPGGRRGCLICETAADPIAAEPEVAARVEAYFDRVRSAFADALRRAQRRGEVDVFADVDALSGRLLAALVGICAAARTPVPREALAELAEGVIATLN